MYFFFLSCLIFLSCLNAGEKKTSSSYQLNAQMENGLDTQGSDANSVEESQQSKLSDEKQAFAKMLTDANQDVFFNQFNESQRMRAMELSSKNLQNITNKVITPDEAVQIVLKDAQDNSSGGDAQMSVLNSDKATEDAQTSTSDE